MAAGCGSSSPDILKLESFTATRPENTIVHDATEISVELRNLTGRGIRMVDGYVDFSDVLGRDLIRISIEPDEDINANIPRYQDGVYRNQRIIEIHPDDVIAIACVRAVVFDDGEVVRFTE